MAEYRKEEPNMNMEYTTKNIDSDLNQIALSYVISHFDVKSMSMEEFYKKFLESRRELSDLWGKH